MKNRKPILIVEDDEIEAEIIARCFVENNVVNPLKVVGDGEEALVYLREGGKPCLITLDLNMPRMNGFEFLKAARAENLLALIPVMILTTSTNKKDIADGFSLGASGYFVKPANLTQFVELIRTFDRYWSASQLPE